jgi:hypothetical protein
MGKNIYEKIQEVKSRLLKANIKKSGFNKFAGYNYYELADFTPFIIETCTELKLFTAISFDKELAKLTIINAETPEEKIEYTSPIEELELKGCNKIQALGGTETYSRRYLYMAAFDIIESDMFDGVNGKEDTSDKKIDSTKVSALKKAIENAEMDENTVKDILATFNYKKLEDIKVADYMNVVNAFKEAR